MAVRLDEMERWFGAPNQLPSCQQSAIAREALLFAYAQFVANVSAQIALAKSSILNVLRGDDLVEMREAVGLERPEGPGHRAGILHIRAQRPHGEDEGQPRLPLPFLAE